MTSRDRAACLMVVAAVSWLTVGAAVAAFPAPARRGPPPPSPPAAPLAEAQKLIETGSLEAAIALLRSALATHPGDADARILLGTALALMPRRSEALDELRAAVRMRPEHAGGHQALGMALSRFVEPEEARRAFEKAIALDPGLAASHVGLALVLAQQGQRGDAIRHLERAAAIQGGSPSAAYAHYLLGLVHREQDEPQRAAEAFERAVALRADYGEALLHLGLVRRRLLDADGALAAFRAAGAHLPEDPQAQHELGRELLRAGQAAAALDPLRRAVRLKPDPAALYTLARALRAAGHRAEAEEVAARLARDKAATAETDQRAFEAAALNASGIQLEKKGDFAGAAEKYASALDLDPLNTVFRRNLALALCRLGRWRDAVPELREVLRLDPDDADATKALYIALERIR